MISWSAVFVWLNDPLNWRGSAVTTGLLDQILAHLGYSGLALLIAVVLAIPAGLAIGHTRKARWVIGTVNAVRALPTTGLLVLLYVVLVNALGSAVSLTSAEIVLVLLALPPILANTAAGIESVSPAVRDAAKGMGMTGSQVLFRVEVPNALPLIFSGLRSSALQVIATATVAAYVGLGGLGRFVFDGLSQRDFPQMVGGAIVVALLAIVVDLVLAIVQRYTVSRGVSGRFRRGPRRAAPDPRTAAETAAATPSDSLEAATT